MWRFQYCTKFHWTETTDPLCSNMKSCRGTVPSSVSESVVCVWAVWIVRSWILITMWKQWRPLSIHANSVDIDMYGQFKWSFIDWTKDHSSVAGCSKIQRWPCAGINTWPVLMTDKTGTNGLIGHIDLFHGESPRLHNSGSCTFSWHIDEPSSCSSRHFRPALIYVTYCWEFTGLMHITLTVKSKVADTTGPSSCQTFSMKSFPFEQKQRNFNVTINSQVNSNVNSLTMRIICRRSTNLDTNVTVWGKWQKPLCITARAAAGGARLTRWCNVLPVQWMIKLCDTGN